MSYLGKVALKASDIRRLDVTSSTSATHTLSWTPPNEQSLIITINGVKQQNNYSISGVTLTLDSALTATDEMEVIGINDIGTTTVPGDGTVTTAKIEDDAVTADKLANSINTEIAANTAKVTNATHTGDVTGATALTIANDAVDIAMLSATGTASATTFLRGDNAWATPTDTGKVLQVINSVLTTAATTTSTSYVDTGLTATITPSSASNKVLVLCNVMASNVAGSTFVNILRDATTIISQTAGSTMDTNNAWATGGGANWTGKDRVMTNPSMVYLDSPSSTSATVYKAQFLVDSSTGYINRWALSDALGGVSTLCLMEIAA